MARPQNNVKIDRDCIVIKVDGRVNGVNNIRCENNNGAQDGFVYTCSTAVADDGDGYQYLYEETKDAGAACYTIPGAEADDYTRNSMAMRNSPKYEGLINAIKAFGGSQFNGHATAEADMVFNEGADALPDGIYSGLVDDSGRGTNFYDQNTTAFSDQLTKVRNI